MHKIDRKVCATLLLALCASVPSAGPSLAQGWPSWADDVFGTGRGRYESRRQLDRALRTDPAPAPLAASSDLRDGGPRPEIAPVPPATVAFEHDFPVNSIVIDSSARALYYVLPDKRAYRYPISVGRDGFNWTGSEAISRKQAWPDWYPPAEMRERDPSLPEKMTGGVKNPLGAMALYLGNSLYRIHGTNDVKSIGQAQSSGCFRMLNAAVVHLASIAEVGTIVAVVDALPARQQLSRASEPPAAAPSQAAPAASPQAQPPAAPVSSGAADRRPDYRSLRDYALQRR